MKQKRFNTLAKIGADAVLLTCAMLAVGCAVPSAFSIPFELHTLIRMSALIALLLSGWLHLPRGGVAFGAVFLLIGVAYCVFDRKMIADGAQYMWYNVLKPLSADFSFLPVPAPIEELENAPAAVTSFLAVVTAVIGMFTALAMIRSRLVLLSLLIPLPLYLVSMIYTNQQPALWTAILMLIYCGGVLVGHGVRKHKSEQSGFLTAVLLPLMLILLLLVRVLSPTERFEPIPFSQRQAMLGRTVGEVRDWILSWGTHNPTNVDLSGEGNRKTDDETVFSLNVSKPGNYLLRTHSYGHYEDGIWMAAAPYDGEWTSMSALGRGQGGYGFLTQFSIRDAYTGERIVPYGFIEDPEVEVSESFVHAQGRTAYVWTALSSPSLTPHDIGSDERAYYAYALDQYTMPDGEEKTALKAILNDAGIRSVGDAYRTAQNVAAFVRSTGTYTLTPGKTPKGVDFVQYFLTEGKQGYCVHFASATTALLQALDIPARYTVGYSVNVQLAEIWTEVPYSASHAWAEVYVAGVGWIPVESTAGFGYSLLTQQTTTGNTGSVTTRPIETPTPKPTATQQPAETPAGAAPTLEPKPGETRAPVSTVQPDEPRSGETVITEDKAQRISPWWLLLTVPVALIAWLLIGSVVQKRRKHAFLQKNAKKAILAMASYHRRLEQRGAPFDPEIDAWAEEAMFSNHAMTAERKEVYRRVKAAQKALYRDKPLKRFWARWVLHLI